MSGGGRGAYAVRVCFLWDGMGWDGDEEGDGWRSLHFLVPILYSILAIDKKIKTYLR